MRFFAGAFFLCGLLLTASLGGAQPPGQPPGKKDKGGEKGGKGGPGGGKAASTDDLVARMMTFDKNGDGKLTKDEVTDERLHRLFDRADANKDGFVTKEELAALFTAEAGGGGFGGPGGGPGGFGPGGFGPGGPPQPGVVLPPFVLDQLGLTDAQKKQIAELQKEVDAVLDKLLTAEQKKQLREFRDRGPGGPGGGPPPKKG